MKTIEEQIFAKEAEIKHYQGVLVRYQCGRWLDQGRRHLAELEEELRLLRAEEFKEQIVP